MASRLTGPLPLAFGGLMLLVGSMAAMIDRATERARMLDQAAVATTHLSDELSNLVDVARATSSRATLGSDRRLDAAQLELITELIRGLDLWRNRMAVQDFAAAAHDDRMAELRRVLALTESVHRSQRMLMNHPDGAQAIAARLAAAARAAGDVAAPAVSATARIAAEGAEDLHLARMVAAASFILTTLLIGLLLVRPLALSYAERGRRLAELEKMIAHAALHDPLTGLPNRRYLTDHLTRVLAAAGRGGRVAAALHVDLDRFKAVNEELGAAAGDRVLRRCATIMRTETRKGDFISRIGADEFIIILSDVTTPEEVVRLAARLIESLAEPIIIDGGDVRSGASVGVAMAEPNRLDADRLLTNVGLALADAKTSGRGRYAIYTDGRRIEFEQRRRVAAELRDALELNELEPFFQPQVCARTGRPLGFEALVRWRHPQRGLLTPAHFLDVAQDSGLIEEIGEMVTRRSLAALAIWRSMGLPAERISLNISAKELRDSGFVDKLAWDVDAAGLEPGNIGIEILESVLIDDDNDPVIRNVAALSSAGFSVELDDFGTGHASIGNLKKFKVNKIKIDRSFVTDIDTLPDQQKITRAMINLAHSLDVEALVEGVETEGELRRLRAMGCDAVQGYLIGRPMAEADALAWLQAQAKGAPSFWSRGGDGDLLIGGLGV